MPSTLSSTDPLLGQLVAGRYRVMRCLGEGGMGKVYMAEHEAIEKRIALKVLHREYSANTDVVERFKQEAISASRIKHPNVIDVFDFGQLEDGACYIAMELLEGQDLGDALQQVGAFDPEQGLRIVLQVSRALGAAHMRGVVHRDLKPENVFLQNTPEGEQVVKIVDFGIAQLRKNEDADAPVEERKRRLTRTGMIFGTPEYMAPEQARGQSVDQRSDIYAVGCILYELLCGSVPFSGSSFLEVLNHHVLTPVTPPTQVNPHVRVSTELEIVVLKSLAKQPEDRFQTMKELSEALLTTPEGMALGRSISSMIGLGDAPRAATARAESRALRTEVHGSPVSRPDASPAASPNGPATNGPTSARTAAPATHTLVDVELPRGSLLPLWIGLASVGLLASAAAFWFLGRESGDETPPLVVEPVAAAEPAEPAEPVGSAPPQQPTPAGTADAGAEQPAPTDPSAQPASGQPSAPPPTAPAKIVVHVSTVPAGAVVTQDGFQVCDTTPCDVSLDPGAAVVLSAKLGSKTGSAKVLAQREQSVTIALGAPAARPKPSGGSSLCEVEVDGLKILRPCQ